MYLDTGTGSHRRLINVTELANDLGDAFCNTLLGFYVFTGEDANSAFRGKGKVIPLRKLLKTPKHQDTFKKLGEQWDISDELVNGLEEFACLMYSFPRTKNINDVRSTMLKKMVGKKTDEIQKCTNIDLSKIPPCKMSFIPHCRKVNYRVAQFKCAYLNYPQTPHAKGHGWIPTNENEQVLEPVWSEGPILPDKLIDLITEDVINTDSCEEDEDSDESEMDCTSDEYDSD